VAQGDIFENVAYFVRLPRGLFEAVGRVMVISHSCDCEKAVERDPHRPISVVPLIRLEDLPGGQDGLVRKHAMSRYWALPEEGPMSEGWAADFAHLQPLLVEDLQAGSRLVSADEAGQTLLVARLLKVLGYRRFEES
jgi:hypothetical protein